MHLSSLRRDLNTKKLEELMSLISEPEGQQVDSEKQEPQNEPQKTEWYEHSAAVSVSN